MIVSDVSVVYHQMLVKIVGSVPTRKDTVLQMEDVSMNVHMNLVVYGAAPRVMFVITILAALRSVKTRFVE